MFKPSLPLLPRSSWFCSSLLCAVLALSLFSAPAALAQSEVPQSRAQIVLSFAPIVSQATSSVVSIYARRTVETRENPFFNDPLFSQLFGDMGRRVPRVQNALGSGVIVGDNGIVVSNFHVVGGADDIRVVLDDRREFAADLILQDEQSDLAILQLRNVEGALPALHLADSDQVEVGDLVLAIGNPFGVGQTVSSGIVSALARSGLAVGSGRGYFIQTDAAINPGNSGGALVDMRGDLVGINTAIVTRSGGSNGIGFAIPANLVAQVIEQAEAGNTRFQRPWMGVTGQAVDASLAEAFGQTLPQGVVIAQLHPESPLKRAGLRAGDVVLSVDDAPVNSPEEMMFRLAAHGIGGEVALTYLRNGAPNDAQVELQAPPETPARTPVTIDDGPLRGVSAVTINPAVAAEYGLPAEAEGVLVVDVRDIGERAGIAAGDIVVNVNGRAIATSAELRRAAADRTRYWEIGLLREGRMNYLRFRY